MKTVSIKITTSGPGTDNIIYVNAGYYKSVSSLRDFDQEMKNIKNSYTADRYRISYKRV